MVKKDLRLKYANLRTEVPRHSVRDFSLKILGRCIKLPIWHLDVFHLFLSIAGRGEVDTSYLLHHLLAAGKKVVVPKIEKGNRLSHYAYTPETKLQNNQWDIPEPVGGQHLDPHALDVIFIPLLAYDIHGNRVGYGKGYYDIFLGECRKEALKVGLSFFGAEDPISDIGPHDVPLDYCITPWRTYSFSTGF